MLYCNRRSRCSRSCSRIRSASCVRARKCMTSEDSAQDEHEAAKAWESRTLKNTQPREDRHDFFLVPRERQGSLEDKTDAKPMHIHLRLRIKQWRRWEISFYDVKADVEFYLSNLYLQMFHFIETKSNQTERKAVFKTWTKVWIEISHLVLSLKNYMDEKSVRILH